MRPPSSSPRLLFNLAPGLVRPTVHAGGSYLVRPAHTAQARPPTNTPTMTV